MDHSHRSDPSLHNPIIIATSAGEEEGESMASDIEIHEIEDFHVGVSFSGLLDRRNRQFYVDPIECSDSAVSEDIVEIDSKCSGSYDREGISLDLLNPSTLFCPTDGSGSRVFEEDLDFDLSWSGCNDRAIPWFDLFNCSHQIPVAGIEDSGSRVFEEDFDSDPNRSCCNDRDRTSNLCNSINHQTHFNPLNGSGSSDMEGNGELIPGLELGLGFGTNNTITEDGSFAGNSAFESSESSRGCASKNDDGGIDPINVNSNREDGSEWAEDDLGVYSLCWDCLLFQDRRDRVDNFDWEEVEQRTEERIEAMNMEIETVINATFDAAVDEERFIQEMDNAAAAEAVHNLGWEVRLAIDGEEQMEPYFVEHHGNFYTTEDEVQFEQFIEAENPLAGGCPTAKSVIENLLSVFLTKEDIENDNACCAVCKDDISLEEQVKRLICQHHYHGDCILPWLRIRNTCPVCRFELPTDDPDYEVRRSQQATVGAPAGALHTRNYFDMVAEE